MKLIGTPLKELLYIHRVKFNRKEYRRKEIVSPQSYKWESTPDKLEDFHTIEWRRIDQDEHCEYYSCDHGWSVNGIMDKSNPIPEIERVFKETVGKGLFYFSNLDLNRMEQKLDKALENE